MKKYKDMSQEEKIKHLEEMIRGLTSLVTRYVPDSGNNTDPEWERLKNLYKTLLNQ